MPAGVKDLCDHARYTMATITGIAIIGFILELEFEFEM